jgi:predicted permease
MLQILSVTFPFFALVLCGYAAARYRLLPLEAIPGLNTFVLYFALPAMLYHFSARTPIAELLDLSVFVTYLACAGAIVGLTVKTTRKSPAGWNDASFGALVAAFPNSGFMGMPLLVALLGSQAAGPVIVSLSADMVITSSVCVALSRLGPFNGSSGAAAIGAMKGMLRNPLPWAILLGSLSSAWQLAPVAPVMRVITMLSDSASPAALFTIGAVLARARMASFGTEVPQERRRDLSTLVVFKLLLHPMAMLALGSIMIFAGAPLSQFSLLVLVLVAALPSASNVPMLAERFGADSGRIARVVLFSTALSFVSFTVAVALAQRLDVVKSNGALRIG